MHTEIIIFWRLPDGTRCSVLGQQASKWRLVVTRGDAELLIEDYPSARALFDRARELRPLFDRAATGGCALAPRVIARSA
jgi:hypothetical protein